MSERRTVTRAQLAVLTLVVAASGIGGIAAAGLADDDPRQDTRAAPPESVAIQEASAAIRTSSEADPRGGPPWSTVEFRAEDGRWCAKPGRVLNGKVGNLDGRGGLLGDSLKQGGDCVDVDRLSDEEPLAWHVSIEEHNPSTGVREPVSFVWGLTRPEIAQVRVSSGTQTKLVEVSSGRAFIAVLPGRATANPVTLEAIRDDGQTRRVSLQPLGANGTGRDLVANPPTPEELRAAENGHE